MRRFVIAMTLLAVLVLTVSLATAQEKVYFGDVGHNKIRRCDLNGANLEELITTGLDAVASIAIDRTAGKMYWTDWGGAPAHIKRANLDGTNVEFVLTGLAGPTGLALDVAAGKIYYTEFSADRIRRANIDGTNIEDLVTTGLQHPNGIALDLGAGKMYFTEGSLFGRIEITNLDGSGRDTLVTGLSVPMEIALDLEGGKMYWADLGNDKIQRANLDGSNVEDLIATGLDTPVGIDLDLDAGKIYFSDSGPSWARIQRCNLDGTLLQNIVSTGIGSCYGLTLGPAVPDCSDASLDNPWIGVISGVEPYDYTVYLIFDGQGTIDEIGSFNVPDSAGMYAIAPDCSVTGYAWADAYVPITGYVSSDTNAEIEMVGIVMPLLKVTDVGALEGCWKGSFVQDTTLVTKDVIMFIDEFGSIGINSGLFPPVTGKMFFESGYLAGHIKTGESSTPWDEIMLRAATVIGDSLMTGTFALDCNCPLGTFNLSRCTQTGARNNTTARSSELHQNYPNPFNPQTTIVYSLADAGRVDLTIYDVAGGVVKTLVARDKVAGKHTAIWGGRDNTGERVGSGVYFVRLETRGQISTRKIVLLK